jgi:ribonuclease D
MHAQKLPPPILVQTQARLAQLAKRLLACSQVAVDTESNSLYVYQERVCLIQFSIPEQDYLVDPFALSDLAPLAPLFASPRIEKVFHASEYDVGCLKRDFDFQVAHIFDTRVACRTLGWGNSGLGDILQTHFNIRLNKRYQRANWGRRPLKPELLHYARMDTHYLLPLRDLLWQELQDAQRLEEALEASEYYSRTEPHSNSIHADAFWNLPDARRLRGRQLSVLHQLYLARDQKARRMDRPPFTVVDDKTLVAIARAMPEHTAALAAVPGMTPGRLRHSSRLLLDAVARGKRETPPKRPPRTHVDDAVLARYERLREWRKSMARKRHIESDLVLPRDMMWKLAKQPPRSLPALQRALADLPWRCRTYGVQILKTLGG